MNVLKPHLQTTITTLLEAGNSHRQIERVTGIDRKTIRTYAKRIEELKANSCGVATGTPEPTPDQIPPPRPPAQIKETASNCEPHRAFIEAQLRFKRNYMAKRPARSSTSAMGLPAVFLFGTPLCDDEHALLGRRRINLTFRRVYEGYP